MRSPEFGVQSSEFGVQSSEFAMSRRGRSVPLPVTGRRLCLSSGAGGATACAEAAAAESVRPGRSTGRGGACRIGVCVRPVVWEGGCKGSASRVRRVSVTTELAPQGSDRPGRWGGQSLRGVSPGSNYVRVQLRTPAEEAAECARQCQPGRGKRKRRHAYEA